MNFSSDDNFSSAILFCALNVVSILVCISAAVLALCLGLYKKLVYRLALYQVLASLAFATVETLEIIFVNYDKAPEVYGRLCATIGYLIIYSEWMKLLFTMWVTFHLFCFAVLHKNLKRLEVLYVVTSLLVPAVIAVVPLLTKSYNISPLGCYIYKSNDTNHEAEIEVFALWNAPALIILFVASIAMVVMVLVLVYRVVLTLKIKPITGDDRYWKALKQLLPLAAFPILFFFFAIPGLVYGISLFGSSTLNLDTLLAASVFIAMWGMTSGMTLIIHISVARLYCKSKEQRRGSGHKNIHGHNAQYSSCEHTINTATAVSASSVTHFTLPIDSLAGDDNVGL